MPEPLAGWDPPHPTCVETTTHTQLAGGFRSYVCGQDCPRPAGPDPARDARVAKRRAEYARAAAIALDRLLEPEGYRVVSRRPHEWMHELTPVWHLPREFNEFGNTCHYPGCTLTWEEHGE